VAAQTGFFTKVPRRQTAQAIVQLRVWEGRDLGGAPSDGYIK